MKTKLKKFFRIPHCARLMPASYFIAITATILLSGTIIEPVAAKSKYAAFIVDHNNGRVLYSRNADHTRFPASLTKMMTLYLLFEAIEQGRITYETPLVVTANAQAQPPSKLGLKAGQTISAGNAIRSLITKSANDIAVTVAENLAKNEEIFAGMMTARARRMGMKNTTFRNASGLPDTRQVTTARDMVILSRRLIRDFPRQYGFFRTKYFTYQGRKFKNHNRLLFGFEGTEGIKTGYIRASGFNLSSSVRRGNKHVVGVVMGGKTAKKRDAHMRSLLSTALKKATNIKKPVRIAKNSYELKNPPKKIALQQKYILQKTRTEKQNRVAKNHTKYYLTKEQGSRTPISGENQNSGFPSFDVQVGAYKSETEARAHLRKVMNRAGNLLDGHRAITRRATVRNKHYFRARFTSFNKAEADTTCRKLEAISFNCIVMSAN